MADSRSKRPAPSRGRASRVAGAALACLAAASVAAIGCAGDRGGPEKAMLAKIARLETLRGDAYAAARDSLLEDLLKDHGRKLAALAPDSPRNVPDTRHALLARAGDSARAALFLGALDHTNHGFWDRRMHSGQPRPDQVLNYLETFDAGFFPLIEENLISLRSGIRTTSWPAVAALYRSRDPERGFKVFAFAYDDPGSPADHRSRVLRGIRELRDPRAIPLLRRAMGATADRNERTECLFALAALRDPDLRSELERALALGKDPEEELVLAVRALALYRQGSESDIGLELYRRFEAPAARLAIVRHVSVRTPEDAGKWRAARARETDPRLKAAIEGKLADFSTGSPSDSAAGKPAGNRKAGER